MKTEQEKKLADMLCVAYAYELQAYHGYLHAYTTVTGPLESVYGNIYKSFMEKELHHLEELGKKIRVMGGMPPIKYPPITLVQEAIFKGYDETLEALQKGEEKALEIYTKIHSAAENAGDLPLVILIEEIIQEEEEHHDELERILMDAPTKNIVEKHDKLVVDAFEERKVKLAKLFSGSSIIIDRSVDSMPSSDEFQPDSHVLYVGKKYEGMPSDEAAGVVIEPPDDNGFMLIRLLSGRIIRVRFYEWVELKTNSRLN